MLKELLKYPFVNSTTVEMNFKYMIRGRVVYTQLDVPFLISSPISTHKLPTVSCLPQGLFLGKGKFRYVDVFSD